MFPIRAVEDDHVDRPGVDVQQCMKLTGTNSSTGLIVLIAHVHQTAFDSHDLLVLTRQRRCGPRARRLAARCNRAAGVIRMVLKTEDRNKRVHLDDGKSFWVKKDSSGDATQLLKCCALPTWWSWRGTCTRSHSEHGREMPLRLWYSVLRRGRVGRCQVCKSQHNSHSHSQPNSDTLSYTKPNTQYRLQNTNTQPNTPNSYAASTPH